MPYDRSTTLTGPDDLSADAIQAAFIARNGAAPADLGAAIHDTAVAAGLRPGFICAQIIEETAAWSSDYATNRNNPAGLGAIDSDPGQALTFSSPAEGIRTECAHWLSYIYGDQNTWRDLDPRYALVLTTPHAGQVRVLGDIGAGVWASDVSYADKIIAIANAIGAGNTAPQGGSTVNEPTEADIGFPVEIDYTTSFPGAPTRALSDIRWFVVHDTEGHEQGSEQVLLGPGASVHALIDTDGAFEYMVPIDTTAWTAGNDQLSRLAVQVELVGFRDGHEGGYTEAQYQSMGAFFRWCVAQGMTSVPLVYIGRQDADGGPLPDVSGMLGHEDVPNPNAHGLWGGVSGHTDPGPLFKWDYFISLCQGAPASPVVPAPIAPPAQRLFAETGRTVSDPILSFWERNGGIPVWGFPIGDLMDDPEGEKNPDGTPMRVQYFEANVLEEHPENSRPNDVQRRRLGAKEAVRLQMSGPGVQFP